MNPHYRAAAKDSAAPSAGVPGGADPYKEALLFRGSAKTLQTDFKSRNPNPDGPAGVTIQFRATFERRRKARRAGRK
jgi:hypothetical protein